MLIYLVFFFCNALLTNQPACSCPLLGVLVQIIIKSCFAPAGQAEDQMETTHVRSTKTRKTECGIFRRVGTPRQFLGWQKVMVGRVGEDYERTLFNAAFAFNQHLVSCQVISTSYSLQFCHGYYLLSVLNLVNPWNHVTASRQFSITKKKPGGQNTLLYLYHKIKKHSKVLKK